jgi:hypothetical protein
MICRAAADGIRVMTIPRKAMVTTALCAAALVGSAGAVPASVASPRSPSADLSRYLGQRLDWSACPSDATELTEAGAQCTQPAVPLDYADPGGRSIRLAISRIKAKDRAHRRGILLSNPGGPGGSGFEYTAHLRPAMEDAADRYDLIGFDPRSAAAARRSTAGRSLCRRSRRTRGERRSRRPCGTRVRPHGAVSSTGTTPRCFRTRPAATSRATWT